MLNYNTSHGFDRFSNFSFPLPIFDSRFLIFGSQFLISVFFSFFFLSLLLQPLLKFLLMHTHTSLLSCHQDSIFGGSQVPALSLSLSFLHHSGKTNLYIWNARAQTRLRLSLIHQSQTDQAPTTLLPLSLSIVFPSPPYLNISGGEADYTATLPSTSFFIIFFHFLFPVHGSHPLGRYLIK